MINPTVDIAFKKIFGVEENKDLLISLINAIVREEDKVRTITLLNPYNPRNFKNDKSSVLDIKAQGETGKRFNIEIQISDEADYDKRALYYWGKMYTEQIGKNNQYAELSKAIGIHILNFFSIPESPKYHNTFVLKEYDLGIKYFCDIELHTIELKKFDNIKKPQITDILSKIKTKLDLWVAFLTRYELLDKNKLPKQIADPTLKKALDVIEEMNFNKEERDTYEDHIKYMRMQASAIKKAEQDFEQLGLEKGIKIGKIEGKIEIAKMMLTNNVSIEDIKKFTGLTTEEIKKLA